MCTVSNSHNTQQWDRKNTQLNRRRRQSPRRPPSSFVSYIHPSSLPTLVIAEHWLLAFPPRLNISCRKTNLHTIGGCHCINSSLIICTSQMRLDRDSSGGSDGEGGLCEALPIHWRAMMWLWIDPCPCWDHYKFARAFLRIMTTGAINEPESWVAWQMRFSLFYQSFKQTYKIFFTETLRRNSPNFVLLFH